MKSPKPKSRTLADFIRRGPDAEVDSSAFHDDPDAIESIEITLERAQQELDAKKQKSVKTKRRRSVSSLESDSSSADDVSVSQKLAQRQAQIEESSKLDQIDHAKSVKAKGPELLDALIDHPDFQRVSKDWSRKQPICWEGAWPGAIAPLVAATWKRYQRPIVVVLAQHQDADGVARDLDFFLEDNTDVFPPASDEILDDALQQLEVIQRLQVLSHWESYRGDPKRVAPPVVVTTLQALMHNVPSRHQLQNDRRSLKVGQRVNLNDLKKWLSDNGYRSTTSVQMPGSLPPEEEF